MFFDNRYWLSLSLFCRHPCKTKLFCTVYNKSAYISFIFHSCHYNHQVMGPGSYATLIAVLIVRRFVVVLLCNKKFQSITYTRHEHRPADNFDHHGYIFDCCWPSNRKTKRYGRLHKLEIRHEDDLDARGSL